MAPSALASFSLANGRRASRSVGATTEGETALPAGYRELNSLGAAANRTGGLPAGYRRVVSPEGEIEILGPKGGVYKVTDRYTANGDTVYENGGKYYSFTDAGKQARFITRADGQTLDSSKISIPGPTNSPYGKMEYLLGKVPGNQDSIGKGGYFGGVLGFKSTDDLALAMQNHLKNNFGSAVIKGNKVEITAPIVGPNGITANVKSAWQIKGDGSVSFVTALPGPR